MSGIPIIDYFLLAVTGLLALTGVVFAVSRVVRR